MRKPTALFSPAPSYLSWRGLPVLLAWSALSGLTGPGCQTETPPPTAPVAAPTAPPAPATPPADQKASAAADGGVRKSKLAPAPTDGLSLAERIERRKADEAKAAAQLAADERQRLLAWDKGKLKLHTDVFGFIRKTRSAYDGAKTKADVENLQRKMEKSIVATGKKLQLIDPKGGNSNVVTDYDVMLNALANDYPQALGESFGGAPTAIAEQRAEMDKRTKKVEDWLRAVKTGK